MHIVFGRVKILLNNITFDTSISKCNMLSHLRESICQIDVNKMVLPLSFFGVNLRVPMLNTTTYVTRQLFPNLIKITTEMHIGLTHKW